MSVQESFHDRAFTVADPYARVRNDHDLLSYATYQQGEPLPAGANVGDFKRIARGTQPVVVEVKVLTTGSQSKTVFARTNAANGAPLGWTSTRNLDGKFINETIGALPPSEGDGRFGPNAAWSGWHFLGQIDLVEIVDNTLEIERIALSSASHYFAMTEAAKAAGVAVALNSGFRSYHEQKFLWEGFSRGLPRFNKAAKPGTSNHQNGIAFNIAVAGGAGSPVYDRLKVHATSFGFLRTVSSEPWLWEYDPAKAATARQRGTFKEPDVSN
ncbi:M15 family metallopeptidase [Ancylobacter amanitiformis]|uniref:D-alanyl-D-alanine carboxypeptidase-like core domain-containing protein n=1 Tax=Ancylobacter amanitiformis TaxID=217069 RepID=A0ABU0LXR6_9HYPH|nr:M15 family metallopeptidase [Ancylobacter amanitiformis]MDQ0513521.1 hypothetical protein [Ancylobacter amanitiformis]